MPEYLHCNLDIPTACLTEVGIEAPGVGEVIGMAVTQVPLAHQVGGVPRLLQVLPRPIYSLDLAIYRYSAELKVLAFGNTGRLVGKIFFFCFHKDDEDKRV
jgi:hypothetical protein